MSEICINERQLWSRGIRRQKALERTKLQHRLNEAKYMAFNVHPTTTVGSMEHVSSESGVANMVPYDVSVVDLAEGVRHHPTGKGAQLLRVIEYALANGNPYEKRLKLSEVLAYAAAHGITVPVVDRMGPIAAVEDQHALNRCKATIRDWFEKHTYAE